MLDVVVVLCFAPGVPYAVFTIIAGLVWLVENYAIWLFLLALVVGVAYGGQPHNGGFRKTKQDIAALAAKKFATEAYPLWLASHPDKACPDTLDDLNEWADSRDGRDPWGTRYLMRCGPGLSFGVISAGEDREPASADDIRSWEQ